MKKKLGLGFHNHILGGFGCGYEIHTQNTNPDFFGCECMIPMKGKFDTSSISLTRYCLIYIYTKKETWVWIFKPKIHIKKPLAFALLFKWQF